MRLRTTDRQLHELEQIEDKARAGSEMVRVPREALRNLLRDHIALNTAVSQRTGELPETVRD